MNRRIHGAAPFVLLLCSLAPAGFAQPIERPQDPPDAPARSEPGPATREAPPPPPATSGAPARSEPGPATREAPRPVLPVPWLGFTPGRPEARDAPPRQTSAPLPPTPALPPRIAPPPRRTRSELAERIRDLLPVRPTVPGGSWLGLLLLAMVLWTLGSVFGRAGRRLPAEGLLPGLLDGMRRLLRLLAVVVALVAAGRALPPSVRPAIPWALLAAAAAVGWSARDVLPDVLAGVLLVLERRIRPGRWVGGEGFAGTVERVGLRASTLRDSLGRRVTVPNRHLLAAPLVEGRAVGAEHEVQLRLPEHCVAADVRAALRDAVLLSPWVPPGAEPVVLRDPVDRSLWTVRAPLLEVRWAARFEGELLERAEELLGERPDCHEPRAARFDRSRRTAEPMDPPRDARER